MNNELNFRFIKCNIAQKKGIKINWEKATTSKKFKIEILIVGIENNNIEFKYKNLDQISFLNLNKFFKFFFKKNGNRKF